MHWLGLLDRARSAGANAAGVGLGAAHARAFITLAAILTIAAQLIFLGNFFWTLLRKETGASRNPWHATTLEWFLRSPVPHEDFGPSPPTVYRSAYLYGVPFHGLDFLPQHISPERLAKFQGDAQ
jgi:cytochrome c oxidase subunit 1